MIWFRGCAAEQLSMTDAAGQYWVPLPVKGSLSLTRRRPAARLMHQVGGEVKRRRSWHIGPEDSSVAECGADRRACLWSRTK